MSAKYSSELVHYFGDLTYGFSLFRLAPGSGPGYKVSAYWPGHQDSAVSQCYIFRDRREAIRAAQHRLVQETAAYVYPSMGAYRRAEKRRVYVGDEPFKRTVLWHSEVEW
ncbi:hypothetical protein ACIQ9Q_09640 [Streptomyces sp. NPDC094438]|uniref:hypothetical protein n=1 Tax=Streptomyces sp. NPDC094438 TaxID=3366061 RepID=UPI00381BF213